MTDATAVEITVPSLIMQPRVDIKEAKNSEEAQVRNTRSFALLS